MKNTEIKISSNQSFGFVFSFIFLIIALWPLLHMESIRHWSIAISIIFFILGVLNSKILTPFNRLWFKFGILLGSIISPIIMLIIFFFVVTPIGLFMRIIGKDLLYLKKNNKKTYWIKKENLKSSMKNQF